MTDIEKKALALVNEVRDERGFRLNVEMQREDMAQEALCRAIEQHEAYKQDVSDAITGFDEYGTEAAWDKLSRFIIPKPDPLVEVFMEAFEGSSIGESGGYWKVEQKFRTALAARGLEVRKIGEGE